MELRHLRYVVAVADSLHFGHAAERLHISQPPLSQQIRQLEEELGVTLFYRTKREVRLTEPGRIFVEEARLILSQAEHAARIADRVNGGERGRLAIGVAGPADAQIFIDILRRFSVRHPQIHLALRNMGSAQQVEAIVERRLHAGFVAAPIDEPSLATVPVIHQPLVVALPPEHPLAARPRVPLKLLAHEPHIMFARDRGPRFYDAVVNACADAGFALNVVHEVDNLYTACALVAAGLGVCLVPAGIQERHLSTIVLRPLRPALPHVESQIVLAYPPHANSELLDLFVSVVREVVAQQSRPPFKVA